MPEIVADRGTVGAVYEAVNKLQAGNSPPKLGGVPASVSEQAGWFQSRILQDFGTGTTPPRCARHPS